jgi:hypothetical protein
MIIGCFQFGSDFKDIISSRLCFEWCAIFGCGNANRANIRAREPKRSSFVRIWFPSQLPSLCFRRKPIGLLISGRWYRASSPPSSLRCPAPPNLLAASSEVCGALCLARRAQRTRAKWRGSVSPATVTPDALAAHVRFDEGSVETGTTARPLRHRQTKGAETDTPDLTFTAPHFYSTASLSTVNGGLRLRLQSALRR